jgi:hypothetical protein
MRTDSAAILRSAFSDSIRLGTLEAFLSGLSSGELQRLHYDFELWARDDQLPPAFAAGGGALDHLADAGRPRRRQDAGRG